MATEAELALPPALEAVRARVDPVLETFLEGERRELTAAAPEAALLVDELIRLVRAGGKRLRPAFCYWGYRAAGGRDDEPIVRAAAALELLHTFALIHDDVMDASPTRRGVAASHVEMGEEAGRRGWEVDERFGTSAAVLVGDLAAVFADRLLHESGFAPETLVKALRDYDRMRAEMGVGQLLDLAGAARSGGPGARGVAALKSGTYTVAGPLCIGVSLAGGSLQALNCLSRYGVPLGEAFQLRDDVVDGEAPPGAADRVNALIHRAVSALDPHVISPEAVGVLRSLAELLLLPE